MARYIDARIVEEELLRWWSRNMPTEVNVFYPYVDKVIQDVPTADIEPLRHGKWIENDNVTYRLYVANNGESYCQEIIYPFVCSECSGGSEYKSRYCMDCGA